MEANDQAGLTSPVVNVEQTVPNDRLSHGKNKGVAHIGTPFITAGHAL